MDKDLLAAITGIGMDPTQSAFAELLKAKSVEARASSVKVVIDIEETSGKPLAANREAFIFSGKWA